jgi:hypothetical protein
MEGWDETLLLSLDYWNLYFRGRRRETCQFQTFRAEIIRGRPLEAKNSHIKS